jgi:hypothetical protein
MLTLFLLIPSPVWAFGTGEASWCPRGRSGPLRPAGSQTGTVLSPLAEANLLLLPEMARQVVYGVGQGETFEALARGRLRPRPGPSCPFPIPLTRRAMLGLSYLDSAQDRGSGTHFWKKNLGRPVAAHGAQPLSSALGFGLVGCPVAHGHLGIRPLQPGQGPNQDRAVGTCGS